MRIQIDGVGIVEVGDEFKSMSPSDQNAFVSNVFQSAKAGARSSEGAHAPPPEAKRSGTIAETVDAAVRGAANALTFGFADRLAAGAGAATGIGGTFGDYEGNLAKQRAVDKANLEQHPVATIGGNIAGALATPVGAVARATTLPGRMAAGAGVGAGQGALFGVSSSPDLTDTATVGQNAVLGAGTGALVGGVAAPVVEGLAAGVSAAARKTGIPAALRGALNPDGSAASLVNEAFVADRASNAPGLSESALRSAIQSGQPAVNADLGGAAVHRLARTAANLSPEAGQTLASVVHNRFETQSPRIAEMLSSLGGGNSVATLDKLKEAAQKANRPLYAKAYAEGASGIWSEELQSLTGAPAVKDAIRGAVRTGANSDIAAGFKAAQSPFTVGADGELSLVQRADGSTAVPSLQFWDHVKRNLDDKIETARRSGENHAAAVIGSLKNKLVSELDQASPTYAAARGRAAQFFGVQDALEAGQKFATAKGKNQEYAKVISQMTKPERELFAHGFMSELENKVREVGDRRNVLNTIFNSGPARQRVEMAVGKERAAELEKFLHAETIMDRLREAVTGNSTTARQQQDIRRILEATSTPALVGSGTYLATGDLPEATAAATVGASLRTLARNGSRAINVKIMDRVAKLLSSRNPDDITSALATIKASKPLRDVLRPFTPAISAAMIANDAERRKGAQ